MGARRGQGPISGVRLPGSEFQHWRCQACDLGTFSPWLSLLCVFRAHSQSQTLLASLLRRLPEITGDEQLASKEENTLGEAPGRGRSPRKWGEQRRLRGTPPGDQTGLHCSDSVAFRPFLLAHPHNDSEKLCTPSTFATRHLSISKASLNSCKEPNFQDNVNIYILK